MVLNLLLFLPITQCITDKVLECGRTEVIWNLFLPLGIEVINIRFLVLFSPSGDGES